MTGENECQGSWRERYTLADEPTVLICDGCGEIMVIISPTQSFTYPPGFGTDASINLARQEALLPR